MRKCTSVHNNRITKEKVIKIGGDVLYRRIPILGSLGKLVFKRPL